MLLTITTTHVPATDLGFLLEKHPAKCQTFPLSFGEAHVFYPEVTEERCTAALLLDLDPIGLVRGRRGRGGGRGAEGPTLGAYVNDRPYVASSFLSVAIAQVFGSALAGRSRGRVELAAQAIPLQARVSAVRCRGGEAMVRRMFEPLGYVVGVERHALDERFVEWGASAYFSLTLSGVVRLEELLAHLYVLVPVLDANKHYLVGEDEVDKLVARGESWLGTHPDRDLIVQRFLKFKKALARDALERLEQNDQRERLERLEGLERLSGDARPAAEEQALEEKISLNEERLRAVMDVVRESRGRSVVDLGCGDGKLLQKLMAEREIARVVGVDVSPRALEWAARRLRLDHLGDRQRERVQLMQASVVYRDERLAGFDVACAVEVIEHLDSERLPAFERVLFEYARPGTVIVTTPNVEYNVRFEGLPAGHLRHRDHRFEWSRRELRSWAESVATRFGYAVRFAGIGTEDEAVGAPTQMAVFSR
jgi:3' terminal RNA ribose 2'-O-methyltransferase Hen1